MDWKPKLSATPLGWGLNSLTDSFNSVRVNQYATFDRKDASLHLVTIDRVLFELLEGNVDISPMFPMNFLLRAHSCFRAACACAMAGQTYEATVLQRAVLETAAYGLYIGDDIDRATTWLKREESSASKDRVRKEFGFGSLNRDFKGRHAEMAASFESLYNRLVDFGAHPNEAGFSISTDIRQGVGQKIIDTVYLHDDEGVALDFGLKNTAQVGLWVVLVFKAVYPGLYADSEIAMVVDNLTGRY